MENKEQQLKENGLRLRITVKDSEGNIINQVEKKSDSLVKNYALFMRSFAGVDNTLIDYTGASIPFRVYGWCNGGGIDMDYFNLEYGVGQFGGIRIGSGTTPVTKDDYYLASTFTTNEFDWSSNEMQYSIDSLSGVFKVIRSFSNISGVDQTVNETGIMTYAKGPNVNNWFLVSRDLTGAQVIPDGGVIEIIYSFNYYW